MARLTQTGSGICSLYELEITFDQVLIDLGLASMAADERERIRAELEIVMDRGLSEISGSRKLNPEGRLQSQDIAASLRSIAITCKRPVDPCEGGKPDCSKLAIFWSRTTPENHWR